MAASAAIKQSAGVAALVVGYDHHGNGCTLAEAGIALAGTRSFPDHHRYTPAEAGALCNEAERDGLVLVTTEKDLARLSGEDQLKQLAGRAKALPVTLAFADEALFKSLLLEKVAAARRRGDR